MIDFSLTPQQEALREEVRGFVAERILPFERDPRWGFHGPSEVLRRELLAAAREAGLVAPHLPSAYGGRDLDHVSQAIVFEAAGYSPLGPTAMNIMAPDEGNMHLLLKAGTEEQKRRWLVPLAAGDIRSCFLMTEPGGAGADPTLLSTRAERRGDGFVIHGRKWLITGAGGAAVGIVMADVPGEGATLFLTPMDAPGIRLVRLLDTIDSSFTGGHYEIELDGLEVTRDQVLGEIGEGFRCAQIRLAPARLTHCMRWLGGAVRAQEIARDHAAVRTAFGRPLGEHEGVGFMLADNEIDIVQARHWVWYAAWVLDRGGRGRHETSLAKVAVSEALYRVLDRCVQILGGLGVTHDTVVARLFQDIRAFRIYDGPSEVHRWAIARRCLRQEERGPRRGERA